VEEKMSEVESIYGIEAMKLFSKLIIIPNPLINFNKLTYENNIMSEAPDVQVTYSNTFKEIHVSGQISNLNYDGVKLTVIHDIPDYKEALNGNQIKASKTTINRQIECAINLSPVNLKSWAIMLQQELKKYEMLFGTILSPEEINEKFKQQPKKD